MQKIKELISSKQWAVTEWLDDCAEQGYEVKISETYRSQERQNKLYAQGRTTEGNIVTYTLSSDHTKRLALDVYAADGNSDYKFYANIAMIARRYNIEHPYTVGFVDLPHFYIGNVPPKLATPTDTDIAKNAFLRGIERIRSRVGSMTPQVIKRLTERLKKRFNISL